MPGSLRGQQSDQATRSVAFSFSETQVAGGADDAAIVRHIRLSGTNRQIGAKLGEIARSRHGVQLRRPEPPTLRARREFYRRNYPNHYERAAGAAQAFGLDVEAAPQDCLELLYNISGAPGCSTVYYPPSYTEVGHALLSRNYDFPTGTFRELQGGRAQPGERGMTADIYVVEVYPDKGIPSLYIAAYDLLGGCLDGVNAAGLTVAILADGEARRTADPARGAQGGLSEIEVPRFLLDTCATVEDAKSALMATKQYYGLMPCHYIIGDRAGRSFIWEYSRAHNREYVLDGEARPQFITNHPVFKYDSPDKFPTDDPPLGSFSRFRKLQEEVGSASGVLSMETIKRANHCVAITEAPSPGRKPDRTLWHSLYDCQDLTLQVDFYLGEASTPEAPPRRSGYHTFRLRPEP